MIVLVGGEKGGTGKSTLATNLCAWLAAGGRDVLLLDADRQSTSANWAAERQHRRVNQEAAPVHCVQRYGVDALYAAIDDLRKRYEEIVIDAGGRDSGELRTALALADKFYAPAKASQSDLWTIDHLAVLVDHARASNRRLDARVLISMAPTNPRINEEREATEMLAEFTGRLALSPCVTRERKAYRDAMGEGKGVVELSDPKASSEIAAIAEEIYGVQVQAEAVRVAGAA